jgi:hypothetical protein
MAAEDEYTFHCQEFVEKYQVKSITRTIKQIISVRVENNHTLATSSNINPVVVLIVWDIHLNALVSKCY